MTAITIDNQDGRWCHVQDTLANIMQAIQENCTQPNDVRAVFHDGSNYHAIFYQRRPATQA
jgi:hypothetical protein